jgi:hypothetical protein
MVINVNSKIKVIDGVLGYFSWNPSGAFFNNPRIHEKAVLFRNPRPVVYIPDDLGQGNHDLITAGLNRLGEHHAVGDSIVL